MEPKDQQAAPANMAGIIKRLEAEIALAEEPARFIATLEGGQEAPGDE